MFRFSSKGKPVTPEGRRLRYEAIQTRWAVLTPWIVLLGVVVTVAASTWGLSRQLDSQAKSQEAQAGFNFQLEAGKIVMNQPTPEAALSRATLLHALFPERLPSDFVGTIQDLYCLGRFATIAGTSGDNNLRGTPTDDVIVGLGGNDVISGEEGNDVLCGGLGADKLFGWEGDDQLFAGQDKDRDELHGGSGNDALIRSVKRPPSTPLENQGEGLSQTDAAEIGAALKANSSKR
jgi:hypothetical protein